MWLLSVSLASQSMRALQMANTKERGGSRYDWVQCIRL
jgi:hypothetical protein